VHFVYAFFVGNGRAAVAEYQQYFQNLSSGLKHVVQHIQIVETGCFPQANAKCEHSGMTV
jgi:hypothetical protein